MCSRRTSITSHLVAVLAVILLPRALSSEWDYNSDYGPDTSSWPPLCHTGKRQSPIDVQVSPFDQSDCTVEPIELIGYDVVRDDLTVLNNGHTVMLSSFDGIGDVQLRHPMFLAPYQLTQIHFHWGKDDSVGSEHQFNGRYFPLEMHMVHKLLNETDPTNVTDGMAVISVIFEIGHMDNPGLVPLINIFKKMESVHSSYFNGSHHNRPMELRLLDVFPDSKHQHFLHYKGSLTTPDCNEVVNWFVLTSLAVVSKSQLVEFRNDIRDTHGLRMHNYRPIQALNGRHLTEYCSQFVDAKAVKQQSGDF